MNTLKKGTWLWTKKAEERAKELGLEERKEGTPAYIGYEMCGSIAPAAWVKMGYVR